MTHTHSKGLASDKELPQYNRSREADPEEAPAAKPDNLHLKERTDSQKLSFGHHIRAAASVPLSPKTTCRNNEQRRAWEVRQFTAVIPVLSWKISFLGLVGLVRWLSRYQQVKTPGAKPEG